MSSLRDDDQPTATWHVQTTDRMTATSLRQGGVLLTHNAEHLEGLRVLGALVALTSGRT